MNNEERDELLVGINDRTIRLEERQVALQGWSIEHKNQHKEERATITRWLITLFSLVGGVIVKIIFWR